jgi:hypothetical protein
VLPDAPADLRGRPQPRGALRCGAHRTYSGRARGGAGQCVCELSLLQAAGKATGSANWEAGCKANVVLSGARDSVHEPLGEVHDWQQTDGDPQAAARRRTGNRAQAATDTEQTPTLRRPRTLELRRNGQIQTAIWEVSATSEARQVAVVELKVGHFTASR